MKLVVTRIVTTRNFFLLCASLEGGPDGSFGESSFQFKHHNIPKWALNIKIGDEIHLVTPFDPSPMSAV